MIKWRYYKIREKVFKYFFILTDYLKTIALGLEGISKFVFSVSAVLFVILFFYHIGFSQSKNSLFDISSTYNILFIALFFSKFIAEFVKIKKRKPYRWLIDVLLFLYVGSVFYLHYLTKLSGLNIHSLLTGQTSIILASFIILFSELNRLLGVINSLKIPPSLLFVLSFFVIIIIGSGLLMLPNAVSRPISYLDALFTSTSAVCVTGLTTIDTATVFTTLGKIIVLSLIQIGGLGIMTFTGFFSYIFTGGSSSLRDRFVLKDILSAENLNSLFSALIKIILFTFTIEFIGAVIIFFNTPPGIDDKFLFSVFHSVSAFCNAGFSTLPQGLFTGVIANNYPIQITIAFLIILGGIGFPVILWFFKYLKTFFVNLIFKIRYRKIAAMVGKDINTSIVLTSTIVLIALGMGLYYLLESDKSLSGMGAFQKVVVTFFGSVSARTAGFNVVDISLWSYPTVFLMIFLMWVGASPGSTGGGIKTTTFAVALLTAFSFIRGKKNLELQNREIGTGTLSRVMVVITLSIVVIFTGFLGLLITDPAKNPVHLLFETVSAFGTVGLSIVNTATLNPNSKIIIIFLMFIGRVGPLTLLTGLFVTNRKKYYKYAVTDIVIN